MRSALGVFLSGWFADGEEGEDGLCSISCSKDKWRPKNGNIRPSTAQHKKALRNAALKLSSLAAT